MKVSSCDYYKIFKNNFLYRTPPVAALHLELNIYMVKMAKILATKSICLNFPRTVNKTLTDRAILKFSTQPEKKCFSQAFKSANCKKRKIPTHVFLIHFLYQMIFIACDNWNFLNTSNNWK